jgi:hypothetical protein
MKVTGCDSKSMSWGSDGVRKVNSTSTPFPAKVYMVLVGNTVSFVCGSADISAGSLPISRKAF